MKLEKKDIMKLVILAVVVICGVVICSNAKSKVKYLDIQCPVCSSDEVGDFGCKHGLGQHGHCFDCGTDFYVEDYEAQD